MKWSLCGFGTDQTPVCVAVDATCGPGDCSVSKLNYSCHVNVLKLNGMRPVLTPHQQGRAASGGPCAFTRGSEGRERRRERERGGEVGRDRVVKMMATDAEEIRIQTSPCPIPDNSLSTLSIKITRKNQDRQWKLRFIYLQCCEYRHTPRRSEQNTGTGCTSPVRKYWKCAATLGWPTFGVSQQNKCALIISHLGRTEPNVTLTCYRGGGGGPGCKAG